MTKPRLAPLALALSLAASQGAQAASLTPPNLVAATSLNNPDLLLVWPYAAGGPLEAMSWSALKAQIASGLTGAFLTPSNNLSDVGNPTIARTNLGLGSAALASTGTSGASLCLLSTACTWSAAQTFQASTTAAASINIPPGAAPTSPNNGDVWTTSNGLFARVGGNNYGIVGACVESYLNTGVANVTGDSTVYSVIFNATQINRGSAYNTGTGLFTAPVTGVYQVDFHLKLLSVTSSFTAVQVAASESAGTGYGSWGGAPLSAGQLSVGWSGIVPMSAGDTLQVQLVGFGGTKSIGIDGGISGSIGKSTFSACLIG